MADKFELTDTTPAPPNGNINVKWQSDPAGNISAYVDPVAAQTPWASDIDAAVNDLNNVGVIRFASYTTPGPVCGAGNEAGTFHLLTDNGGSINLESLGTGRVMISTDSTRRLVIRQNGNVGIGPSMNPSYTLDVQGDVNCEGVYRVDGVPISTGGQPQTPWAQNIDAAGFALTGVASINSLGFQADNTVPGNNQIIRSTSAGFIWANHIYNTSNNNGTTAITRVYASNDEYMRYYTLANFAAQIKPLAQTPWAQNVDAAGFQLTNVNRLGILTTSPQAPLQVGTLTDGTGEATGHGQLILSAFAPGDVNGVAPQGLEFKNSPGGAGFGWKLSSVGDSGAIGFVVSMRQNNALWTEALRFAYTGAASFPFKVTANNGLVLLALPTVGTGPSGTVWRDAAAGNVLKIVP